MGYIGSQPATNFETVRKQVSTTNSGTTITLDYSVSSVQDILVTVNAVVQSYDNYSVSGTTLTLGGTLNNDRVEILYVGRTFQTVSPAVGTVTNEMLSGSIANSKLVNSSVSINGSSVSLGGSLTGIGESNTPYFKAYTSGSTQQGNSGAYTDPVAFATEMFDSDNAFASNIFTVPSGKAGKYFFHAQIEFYQNMFDCYVLLVKNSTNVSVARNKRQADSSLWSQRTVTVSTILDMAVGDTMKVKVYAETSDSQYNIFASETSNYFEGFRIAT